MTISVRPEEAADAAAIHAVIMAAFGRADEADLVDRLRADGDSVISQVAVDGDAIVGYVLFSRMTAPFRALGLAPVSVAPTLQRAGIGGQLIRAGLEQATRDGWQGVFVLGEPEYYGRFGFKAEDAAGFTSLYAGPYLMAQGLNGPLPVKSGAIAYAAAFDALS